MKESEVRILVEMVEILNKLDEKQKAMVFGVLQGIQMSSSMEKAG